MLVPLHSPEGNKLLEETNLLQKPLLDSFRKQRGNTVCGLASLAVVLTAQKRSLAKKKKNNSNKSNSHTSTASNPSWSCLEEDNDHDHDHDNDDQRQRWWFVDEDDVYPMLDTDSAANDDDDTSVVVSEDKIRKSGMTLEQVRALAAALPTTEEATAWHPPPLVGSTACTTTSSSSSSSSTCCVDNNDDSQATKATTGGILQTPQDLRNLVTRVLSSSSSSSWQAESLILNYHMSTLGQVPFGGHLSPVAAYHATTDRLLILDVWHTQTEPVWALVETVWEAMGTVDPESRRPRGILHLVHSNSN